MNPKAANLALGTLVLFVLSAGTSLAQVAGATLSGTLTSIAGAAVPAAQITVKNVATGQSFQAQTNAAGAYSIADLAPGDYEVSATAEGFTTKVAKVRLAAGVASTLDFRLTPTLSLQGLGFPASETQGNAQEQARLNKRSRMLKTHQKLGLITTGPMLATVIAGGFAGGRHSGSTGRDVHAALGSATAVMYFTTASYAIFAPKIPGTKTRGPIRVHKALAWIHGPGMVLTPILGAMAFSQRSQGQRVHGIASAHGAVGLITAGAYVAAMLSVSVKF